MKKIYVILIAVIAVSLTGCATTPSIQLPNFTPSLLGSNKDIAIVFDSSQQGTEYGINQQKIASDGGALQAYIEGSDVTNSAAFTKAVFGLDRYSNLYSMFYSDLVKALSADGYSIYNAKHNYGATKFDATATDNGGKEWVVYIEGLKIQYFANTMISSYKPRTGVWISMYNSKTKVLYKAILVDIKMDDERFSFPIASGIMKDVSHSFGGLKENTKTAVVKAKLIIAGS